MLNFKIGTIIRSIDKSGVDLPHAAKEFLVRTLYIQTCRYTLRRNKTKFYKNI